MIDMAEKNRKKIIENAQLEENPFKKLRKKMDLSREEFAEKIGEYYLKIRAAEIGELSNIEELVRKTGLALNGINEGKLLNDYRAWERIYKKGDKNAS